MTSIMIAPPRPGDTGWIRVLTLALACSKRWSILHTFAFWEKCTGPRMWRLFVEKESHQFSVHLQAAVVIDEAQLAKPVHKEADSRTGGANHLSQGPLAHLQDGGMRLGLRSKAREQQQRPRQPPLAGIEKLIEEIFFHACNAR